MGLNTKDIANVMDIVPHIFLGFTETEGFPISDRWQQNDVIAPCWNWTRGRRRNESDCLNSGSLRRDLQRRGYLKVRKRWHLYSQVGWIKCILMKSIMQSNIQRRINPTVTINFEIDCELDYNHNLDMVQDTKSSLLLLLGTVAHFNRFVGWCYEGSVRPAGWGTWSCLFIGHVVVNKHRQKKNMQIVQLNGYKYFY